MSIKDFIKEHRQELTEIINKAIGKEPTEKMNDNERESWILNDEGLYNWARGEGVRI